MKRSTKIMTATMLTGMVFLTAACQSEQNQVSNFSNPTQCYGDRPSDVGFSDWREICDNSFANAQAAHTKEAPRYAPDATGGDDICEDVHGDDQCQRITDSNGNSWFVPLMAGYFVGSVLNNDTGRYSYGYSNARPLYRTSSGGYTNGTFSYNTSRLNSTTAIRSNPTRYTSPSTPKTYTSTTAVRSSGGFGASGTRSSGGSFGG